jgi:hypothetical protein
MPQPNPLSKADRAALRKAVHGLSVAKEHVAVAKAAGLPVEEQEQRIEHLMGIAQGILAQYDGDTIQAPENEA